MKSNVYRTIISILVVAVGIGGVGIAVRSALVHQREVRAAAVQAELTELRSLVTARYRYRDVVWYAEETRVLGFAAGNRETLFSVNIDVTAGVVMDDRVEVVWNDRGDTVLVTLPAPEILRVDADERSIEQLVLRERMGQIDWLDVADEVERAKERNREDAITRGILDAASREARRAVQTLMRATGPERVEVRVQPVPSGELRG